MPEKRLHLISLGCPKNLVDSEYILGRMAELGWSVEDAPGQADVIMVNTCSFIRSAVEEAVETLLQMGELKHKGSARYLVVLGCLPQRYQDELVSSLPEVDLFWGSGGLENLPGAVEKLVRGEETAPTDWKSPGFAPARPGPRLRSAPFYQAYLKIAEGCSNACSYCLIPFLRGPYRSREMGVLIEEAAALAASGVRELILVAQDTTNYGRDLGGGGNLPDLLEELAAVDGLEWLRVMYAYPSGIDDRLIRVMAEEPKICAYLDLPLQHASPPILKRMGRRKGNDPKEILARLRSGIPDLTLRTTMMVGFPGETDHDFQFLLDFVTEVGFDRLGVFKFSAEEGAPASGFAEQVPQRIKENRRRKLMAVQRKISRKRLRALVGKTLPVLVEGFYRETDLLLAGRTRGQAPEIDGQVLITMGTAPFGSIQPVLITEAHDYDLVGELVA